MSFKRLMLIISIVVGTVYGGNAMAQPATNTCYGVPGATGCVTCEDVVNAYKSVNWAYNISDFSQCATSMNSQPMTAVGGDSQQIESLTAEIELLQAQLGQIPDKFVHNIIQADIELLQAQLEQAKAGPHELERLRNEHEQLQNKFGEPQQSDHEGGCDNRYDCERVEEIKNKYPDYTCYRIVEERMRDEHTPTESILIELFAQKTCNENNSQYGGNAMAQPPDGGMPPMH